MSYLKDLSRKVIDGTVEIRRMEYLADEKIIEELVKVKGIGKWTAEMFLMFHIGRLDVFPDTDLGIVNGIKSVYRLKDPVSFDKMKRIADRWRPYRSIGSWYIWQHKDSKI